MKEYTVKQMKELGKNPYVYKVTKHKLYYTAKFKEDFWISYQAGNAPRKILSDFGFDIEMFGEKQIDSLVQRIKNKLWQGMDFRREKTAQNAFLWRKPQKKSVPLRNQ